MIGGLVRWFRRRFRRSPGGFTHIPLGFVTISESDYAALKRDELRMQDEVKAMSRTPYLCMNVYEVNNAGEAKRCALLAGHRGPCTLAPRSET